jgi:predicted oxidoreductase
VRPASFGTFAGLKTNGQAQVLDQRGKPISGLYAVGTDMASVMGGHYRLAALTWAPD